MITQTIHVGDCELLERWIDLQLLAGDTTFADWDNREWIEGLNASNRVTNSYAEVYPWLPDGSSECIEGWRGLSPLTLNPHFGTAPGLGPEEQAAVEWTHFADLVNIYGRAEDGFARRTFDNVGVQYGLEALRAGDLTVEQFLDLNARAGGWKQEAEMVQEGCPFIAELCPDQIDTSGDLVPDVYPGQIDPWSWRNMTVAPGGGSEPAPRAEADPGAIEAAYASGMVNRGAVEIPIIDWRNYLERELDMHNSHQSFAARQRLLDWDGDASNQVIWFTDVAFEGDRYDQTPLALEVIDEWMGNIADDPDAGVAANKPARAVDSCFDTSGELIYAGEDAWNGILDEEAEGPCAAQFETYATSRIKAGGPITGDVFKCATQPVADALAAGVYGGATLDASQRAALESIFPTGVCDYTVDGVRRPDTLPGVQRVAGPTRFETALAVSQRAFDAAEVAVLARGDLYPDALVGTALGLPLLLTRQDRLPDGVLEELRRLGATEVVLLGSRAAVGASVEAALAEAGYQVTRVAGPDRFATAAQVATGRFTQVEQVVLVRGVGEAGRGWADAASAGWYAQQLGAPLLLTEPGQLPQATDDALGAFPDAEVIIVGGPPAVSEAVAQQLRDAGRDVTRLAGPDRYATSVAVYEAAVADGMDADATWVATGENFPDSLTAGAAVGHLGETFLLVHGDRLDGASDEVARALGTARPRQIVVTGDRPAVSAGVLTALRGLLE